MKKIEDYLHLYLGCEIMTPDGIGWLASVSRDRRKMDGLQLFSQIKVDFKTIRLTENSVDGYDKKRNYGIYLIEQESYVGINAPEGAPPEFTMPGGCKPLLRPISDMTEEEAMEIFILPVKGENIAIKTGEEFRKMLSKHFDLFSLIEAGLAIDKTNTKAGEK